MPTTTKLSDTQLVILSQAAQRPDYCVLPMPPNLQAKAGPVTRALKALLKRGLILEQAGSNSDHEWRRDENGALLTLVIATAGLAAIGSKQGITSRRRSGPRQRWAPPEKMRRGFRNRAQFRASPLKRPERQPARVKQ